MQDKYKMTRAQAVAYAKRNLVDSIWKSANLEGIQVTFPATNRNSFSKLVFRIDN